MEQIVNNLSSLLNTLGPIAGFLIVMVESIIPILPLAAFITLNVITFGNVLGFLLSWVGTIFGCMIMFFLCKKLNQKLLKKYENNKKIMGIKKKIDDISFSNLVIILAIPFTPAFAVNIAAGLSDISTKKYFYSLIIGKIPMVYFWTYIGKSLGESLTDPTTIIKICIMLILAFLASKLANKYLKI